MRFQIWSLYFTTRYRNSALIYAGDTQYKAWFF